MDTHSDNSIVSPLVLVLKQSRRANRAAKLQQEMRSTHAHLEHKLVGAHGHGAHEHFLQDLVPAFILCTANVRDLPLEIYGASHIRIQHISHRSCRSHNSLSKAADAPSSSAWAHSKVTSNWKGFVKAVGLSSTVMFVSVTYAMAPASPQLSQSRFGAQIRWRRDVCAVPHAFPLSARLHLSSARALNLGEYQDQVCAESGAMFCLSKMLHCPNWGPTLLVAVCFLVLVLVRLAFTRMAAAASGRTRRAPAGAHDAAASCADATGT